MNSRSSLEGRPTAGIIIIGDEILKGHTQDTNSFYLCRRLHALGVDVRKISVIPDTITGISQEVKDFSSRYTFVLTTGGVGPTHDDMTYAGIAKAFDESLVANEELRKMLLQYEELQDSVIKMALVPQSANVHYIKNKDTGEMFAFPIISVRNVFIFPGIPEFLEMAFEGLSDVFHQGHIQIHALEMFLNLEEYEIITSLDKAIEFFHNKVRFGTYPAVNRQDYYKAKLTMESGVKQNLQEAFSFLQNEFPLGSVVFYRENVVQNAGLQLYDDFLQNCTENDLKQQVRTAVEFLEQCVDRFKMSEVCISFNGGKDCTALLHLLEAVKQKKCTEEGDSSFLQAVYFRGPNTFPEIEQFIQQTTSNYFLKLYIYEGEIQEGLNRLITDYPEIRAVVMGCRRTDPHMSDLSCFQMTDPSWPQVLRVNPLIYWSYNDIWMYIRQFCIPYCSLYDKGYSSLGDVTATFRNPELVMINDDSRESYRPAYMLNDVSTERSGRQSSVRRDSEPAQRSGRQSSVRRGSEPG
uniref:FAD synthase n=1 Tax=Strigamia maritima TaxID=126957 RepID=T1J278_STRMM